MTRITRITRITRTSITAAVAALVAVGAATAAGTPSPGTGAPTGISTTPSCATSCIQSAIVQATASSAGVTVKTSLPTSTTVTVTELHPTLGLTAGAAPKHTVLPAFARTRTVQFLGLYPETTYRIAVSARDGMGNVDTRTGTFTTRRVKVAVSQPQLGFGTTVACGGDCIEQGIAKPHASEAGRVDFTIHTTVPASMRLEIYRRDGDVLRLERAVTSASGQKTWTPAVRGLRTGTRFDVALTATDAQGRAHREWGVVRTRNAQAVVTFHKVRVLADGEAGRGEIAFNYFAGDASAPGNGFHKIGSGDTVAAVQLGTSRETVTIRTGIDGLAALRLSVQGVECDDVLMKNCAVEAGRTTTESYAGDTYLTVTTDADLPALMAAAPAGSLVWEASYDGFAFRVYATIAFEVVS